MSANTNDSSDGKSRRTYPWQTVHIFISSTFNDMHAERDYLVKEVFPELRDWCEQRKLRLVDIDLRWGVTETDATKHKRVVDVCLGRIDDCRPFFVCLLGQRYGWVPKQTDVAEETRRKFPGLGKAIEQSASVTEMEVLHALLRAPFDQGAGARLPTEHAFFYLRAPGYVAELPADPPELRRTYSDDAETDAEKRAFLLSKQADLCRTVRDETNRPARPYSGQWNPDARTPELALPLVCPSSDKTNRKRWRRQWKDWAGVETAGEAVVAGHETRARAFNDRLCAGRLETFRCEGRALGEVILEDLKSAILARYPDRRDTPEQDDLEQEIDRHEDFARTATDVFIERSGDFAELDEYATGDSRKLFVLVAKGGLGKSTLLANWVARFRARADKLPCETIHARFVGVGETSSTVDALLRSILSELRRTGKLESETPDNPNVLRSKFAELLGECAKKGRVIVVIDALNQLQSGFADLEWLARTLPENVKLVVSFKVGDEQGDALAAAMRADSRVTVSDVHAFTELQNRRDLVAAYLNQYLKELDEQHVDALVQADGAENPLFLKVVLTELRVFGAFARLGEMIKHEFGTTPQSAFDAVLSRLENDPSYTAVPSQRAVPLLFGLLAHSRGGLPEDLLVRMFLDELGFGENHGDDMRATIRLLLRQVRPFLARRDGRTDFFYEAFQIAARGRYTEGEGETASKMPDGSADGGIGVASSVSRPGQPLGFWRKLLGRVRSRPLMNANRDVEPAAGRSIGPAPLSPHRWPRSEWHRRLARACERWPELDGSGKRYALGNIVHHGVEAGHGAAAAETMTDFAYHYERLQSLGRNELVNVAADFMLTDLATGLAPATRERLGMWKAFHAENAHLLRREVSNLAPETYVLQLAVAHAETSPVTASAERWLEVVGRDAHWLRSVRRPRDVERRVVLRSLEGHTHAVHAVAILPDGRRAISAGHDNTIKLWDFETGKCLRTVEGHTGPVNAVALSSDGRRALSGSADNSLKLWVLDTGQCVQSLKGHTGPVNAVALSSDSRLAVSASHDNTVKLWDLETGRCQQTLKGHTGPVNAVALLPDGCRALSGSADKTLKLWDLDTRLCLQILKGHTDAVNAVALSSDGRRALSGSADNTVKLWDLDTGQCVQTLQAYMNDVHAVVLSSDGRRALSGSADNTLKLWDLDTGRCVQTLHGHELIVSAVALLPDGRRALSGSYDKTLKLWDLEAGPCHMDWDWAVALMADGGPTVEGHTGPVNAIALLPDGRRALSASDDNTLRLWDLETGQSLRTLEGHMDYVHAVVLSSDGRRALSRSAGNTLKLWDLDTGQCVQTFKGHELIVRAVVILPDGRRALLGGWAFTLWDLDTGQCLQTLKGHEMLVNAVALLPDGRRALSGSYDSTLKLWDLDTGLCLRTFAGHTGSVDAIAVSSDGRRALSGSCDSTLKLWDLDTGLCLRTFAGCTGPVNAVALSSDGHHARSTSGEDTFTVWDLDTGQCLQTLHGVSAVELLPDGDRALSASGTLKLWELKTGLCLATWHAGSVVRCGAATPDVIVAGTEGGDVLFLKLMPPGRISPEIASATWHPSSSVLAVARANNTILVQAWHPDSQYLEELARTASSVAPLDRLQWSRDGTRVLAIARDGTQCILDAESLREIPSAAPSDWVAPRDVSPDGLWRAEIRDGRLEIVSTASPRGTS